MYPKLSSVTQPLLLFFGEWTPPYPSFRLRIYVWDPSRGSSTAPFSFFFSCVYTQTDSMCLLMHLLDKFKRPLCNWFFTADISPGNQSSHPSCQRRRIYRWSSAAWCQVIPGFGCFSAAMSHSICLPDVTAERWGVLVGDSGVTGRCFQILMCAEPSVAWSSLEGIKSMRVLHVRICTQGWSVHSGWWPGLVDGG